MTFAISAFSHMIQALPFGFARANLGCDVSLDQGSDDAFSLVTQSMAKVGAGLGMGSLLARSAFASETIQQVSSSSNNLAFAFAGAGVLAGVSYGHYFNQMRSYQTELDQWIGVLEKQTQKIEKALQDLGQHTIEKFLALEGSETQRICEQMLRLRKELYLTIMPIKKLNVGVLKRSKSFDLLQKGAYFGFNRNLHQRFHFYLLSRNDEIWSGQMSEFCALIKTLKRAKQAFESDQDVEELKLKKNAIAARLEQADVSEVYFGESSVFRKPESFWTELEKSRKADPLLFLDKVKDLRNALEIESNMVDAFLALIDQLDTLQSQASHIQTNPAVLATTEVDLAQFQRVLADRVVDLKAKLKMGESGAFDVVDTLIAQYTNLIKTKKALQARIEKAKADWLENKMRPFVAEEIERVNFLRFSYVDKVRDQVKANNENEVLKRGDDLLASVIKKYQKGESGFRSLWRDLLLVEIYWQEDLAKELSGWRRH